MRYHWTASAAGLGGKDTIKRNLKGGDVKEGILLNKKTLWSFFKTQNSIYSKSMSR